MKPAIYHISVTETLCKTVRVYAESEDAALSLVRDRYRDRDIELYAEDLDGTDFDVLDHEDDADPANADYNAVDPAPKTADEDGNEDDEPPALENVLASIASRAPKSTVVLLDGAKSCAIPAAKVGELLAPKPEQATMSGILDAAPEVSKEWRDSMRPQYTRDLNGQVFYVTQATMF